MHRTIWNYYYNASDYFFYASEDPENGIVKDQNKINFNPKIYDYFRTKSDHNSLNLLTRAMLSEPEARAQLRFVRGGEDALDRKIAELFPDGLPEWETGSSLNGDQMLALKTALVQPVSFIKGPPGTGKTKVILNILNCIADMDRRAAANGERPVTAYVTSCNNTAIENVSDDIFDIPDDIPPDHLRRYLKDHFARLGNSIKKQAFTDSIMNDPLHNGLEPEFPVPSGAGGDLFREHFPMASGTIHSLKTCFEYEFDYVIVDEASQVNIMLGLVAISSAKHLILVGDTDQLPPVGDDSTYGLAERMYRGDNIPELYRLTKSEPDTGAYDPRSFLEMCKEAFECFVPEDAELNRMLTLHYRCHPNIIDFCNENIYNSTLDLSPVTDRDRTDICPVRVLWYNGDYCEKCLEIVRSRRNGAEIRRRETYNNQKQIEIFLREELPDITRKLQSHEIEDVCILSPYRGLVNRLKTLAGACERDLNVYIRDLLNSRDDETETAGDMSALVLTLQTIHKSQGKEYDVVYLIPVEDDTDPKWPWSQNRNMINVAVSRAKKELRIITSSLIMSKDVRDYIYNIFTEREKTPENILYTQKLLTYAAEKFGVIPKEEADEDSRCYEQDSVFGFHRSSLDSVFDVWRRLNRNVRAFKDNYGSLCESIVVHSLRKMSAVAENGLEIARNVKLRDLVTEDICATLTDDQKGYISNGAEFDIVLYRMTDRRLLMAIEVDGPYHRINEQQQINDSKKDEIVRAWGGVKRGITKNTSAAGDIAGSFIFIRMPCDGTTYLETDTLQRELEERIGAEEAAPFLRGIITLDKYAVQAARLGRSRNGGRVYIGQSEEENTDVAEKIFRTVNEQYIGYLLDTERAIYSGIKTRQAAAVKEFAAAHVHFAEGMESRYDNVHFQQMYLLRYMHAYAAECKLAYTLTKNRLYDRENPVGKLNILSVGCGSCIDYRAAQEVFRNVCGVRYTGVDLAPWEYIFGDAENDGDFSYHNTDIIGYMKETYRKGESDTDLYVFSKSVSDLKPVWDDLCDKMARLRYGENRVAFLGIYRSFGFDDDAEQFGTLRAKMEQKGFRLVERLSDSEAVEMPVPPADDPENNIFGFMDSWLCAANGGVRYLQSKTDDLTGKCLDICRAERDGVYAEAADIFRSHGIADGDMRVRDKYFYTPIKNLSARCQLLVFEK